MNIDGKCHTYPDLRIPCVVRFLKKDVKPKLVLRLHRSACILINGVLPTSTLGNILYLPPQDLYCKGLAVKTGKMPYITNHWHMSGILNEFGTVERIGQLVRLNEEFYYSPPGKCRETALLTSWAIQYQYLSTSISLMKQRVETYFPSL